MRPLQIALRFACLLTRAGIARGAGRAGPELLAAMGALALLPGLGFLVIWAAGLRRSGAETFGSPIWWDALRPLHGALWLAAGALALSGRRGGAASALWADVAIGAVAMAARTLSELFL